MYFLLSKAKLNVHLYNNRFKGVIKQQHSTLKNGKLVKSMNLKNCALSLTTKSSLVTFRKFDRTNAFTASEATRQLCSEVPSDWRRLPFPAYGWVTSVVKPVVFVLFVAGGSLYVANSDQAKEWRRQRAIEEQKRKRFSSSSRRPPPSSGNPVVDWWNGLEDAQKTVYSLIVPNVVVFGMWQLPQLQSFMAQNFLHSVINPQVLPVITACFSHKSFLHLAFNMWGLVLFGEHIHNVLGREQMLAIYFAGGAIASLSSHFVKLAMRDPVPSLGASGAIFAIVAASCYYDPHTELRLMLFPFFTFTKHAALIGAAAFDTIGLLLMVLGKNFFKLDHAAHLGGAAFGYLYSKWLDPRKKHVPQRKTNRKM